MLIGGVPSADHQCCSAYTQGALLKKSAHHNAHQVMIRLAYADELRLSILVHVRMELREGGEKCEAHHTVSQSSSTWRFA